MRGTSYFETHRNGKSCYPVLEWSMNNDQVQVAAGACSVIILECANEPLHAHGFKCASESLVALVFPSRAHWSGAGMEVWSAAIALGVFLVSL